MLIKAIVLAEHVEKPEADGPTYRKITCMEVATAGEAPLLQMFDYGLRGDEESLVGKLQGKRVNFVVQDIPRVFGVRFHINGKMTIVDKV